ncbi:hypothetical protein CVT24_009923 [Panaeolus cyanescens]|uniref:C2H2-type domain-containing protein n=1 Tax=Panaeolus cyanescens TaxID=181874 RepID=A0A409WU42_9AGAR|nr:hypothetical protein CVT24_009923 [Panaeolus cyanescens]
MSSTSARPKKQFTCDDCHRSFGKNLGLIVHQRSCAKKINDNAEFLALPSNSNATATQPRPKKKARCQSNQLDPRQTPGVEIGLSEKGLGKRRALDTQDTQDFNSQEAIDPMDQIEARPVTPVFPEVDQHIVPMDVDMVPQTAHLQSEQQPEVHHPSEVYVPPPTRRGCERRFPKRYDDFLPCTSTRIPHMPPPPPPPPPPEIPRSPTPPPLRPPSPTIGTFTTNVNEFGMYRVYPTLPSREVEENEELANICDGPGFPTALPTNLQWDTSSYHLL